MHYTFIAPTSVILPPKRHVISPGIIHLCKKFWVGLYPGGAYKQHNKPFENELTINDLNSSGE